MELGSSESVAGSEDDEMTIDDVDDHDDEQAPAFLLESEAYHERLLACLSTAEIRRIKDMSKQLQDQSSTTTTTKNNMFGRIGVQGNGSNQPVGRVGVGVGECMSYYNVDSFKKICKSNNTTKITTTNDNDNDNDDTNYDNDSTTSHVHAGHVDRQKTRVAGSPNKTPA